MDALKRMLDLKLLSCRELFVGLERNWITTKDIVDYAVQRLSEGDEGQFIVLLAGINRGEEEESIPLLKASILAFSNELPDPYDVTSPELRKWLLTHLMAILDKPESDEEKLLHIQEIYGEFGFPDEMAECSPYFFSEEEREKGVLIGSQYRSPLQAANELVQKLKAELAK